MTVVAAENKRYARVAVINTVIEAMEAGMKRWDIRLPK